MKKLPWASFFFLSAYNCALNYALLKTVKNVVKLLLFNFIHFVFTYSGAFFSFNIFAKMGSQENVDALVNKLYEYRDNFIQNIGVEHVLQKADLVKVEMEKTLTSIKAQEEACSKTQFLFYLGKTLNVMPEYSEECEGYLSKVIKRDPSHIEAWNMLGETFWKKGNLPASKDCFEGALKRKKDKVSLRSLSMVLRQLKPAKIGDEQKHVLESVEHAKAAVELDVVDGKSWYILGNAYLSLFFVTEQNPKVLVVVSLILPLGDERLTLK